MLVASEQRKLDRVLSLEFSGAEGFVETAAATLITELTGRNCNVILLDDNEIVLGAAREIRSDINRFREIVAGRSYLPPPPYEKLDPRSTSREDLRESLTGSSLRSLRATIDGIGPQLSRALSRSTGLPDNRPLDEAELERVLDTLERLVREPSRVVREALELPDAATLRRRERRKELLERLRREIGRELELVEKRLTDLQRARRAAAEADKLRGHGDLLLAFANRVPEGAASVALTDFSGESVNLTLDPAKNGVANAQGFYERARKREARARQADIREPELRNRQAELSEQIASLESLSDEELESLLERLSPAGKKQRKSGTGVKYVGPHGYAVLVGRSARENDALTFKVARSRDVWLHVQGYHGAHVIIQAENREVPFDTILFAAQLAAAYSKASDSENVPVDYTQRKNVWKVKGQSAGAVNFTRHKTVYVTPSRRPAEETQEG